MQLNNRTYNINKLELIGAILIVTGDFIDLLVTYQEYCDSLNEKAGTN